MSKKTGRRPTNPFPKNNNLNPNGRPPLSPELKLVRNLTQEQLAQLGKLMLEKNYDELELIANSPQSNALLAMIASAIAKAVRSGNWEQAEFLMQRIVGKPKENLEVTLRGAESFAQLMAAVCDKKFGNEPSRS